MFLHCYNVFSNIFILFKASFQNDVITLLVILGGCGGYKNLLYYVIYRTPGGFFWSVTVTSRTPRGVFWVHYCYLFVILRYL